MNCLNTALALEASRCGMAQGELNGDPHDHCLHLGCILPAEELLSECQQ